MSDEERPRSADCAAGRHWACLDRSCRCEDAGPHVLQHWSRGAVEDVEQGERVSEVSINLGPQPRMVVVHFYDATGGPIRSDVVADPANMEVPVPYGAASFTATWAQDAAGEPVISRATSVITASDLTL